MQVKRKIFLQIKTLRNLLNSQKQPKEVFYKKGVLRNFVEFKPLAQMFSWEFYEIFKNNFLTEHLWTTASE